MRRVTRTGVPLRVASLEANLNEPTAVIYDLPPDFWHPCMGPREEDTMEDFKEKNDTPNWLQRLGVTVIAGCTLAIIVAVTVRVVVWALEGM